MKKIFTVHPPKGGFIYAFSFVFIFSLLIFNDSFATDFFWTGAVNTNYNNLSNWNTGSYGSGTHPSVLPSNSDDLYIGGASSSSDYTVYLNISDTINSLIIEGDGEVFMNTST